MIIRFMHVDKDDVDDDDIDEDNVDDDDIDDDDVKNHSRPLHVDGVDLLLRSQLPWCPPAKIRLHNADPKIKPPLVVIQKNAPPLACSKTYPHLQPFQNMPPPLVIPKRTPPTDDKI